jgi:hypothetical protein
MSSQSGAFNTDFTLMITFLASKIEDVDDP